MIFVSCAGINGIGWLRHFKLITKLDWKSGVVNGSARYLRRECGCSLGRTLVLIDESQRVFDPAMSSSGDLWDLIKNIISTSGPDSGVTVILAAMYNVQLEGPAVPAGGLSSPVRFQPGALVDLR